MRKLTLILVVLSLLVLSGTTVLADDSGSDNATVQLEVTIVAPASSTSGGGGTALYPVSTNIFGETKTYYTEYYGDVYQTIRGTSPDGNLGITIPKYTTALGPNGKRLESLSISVNDDPPPPPENTNVIGLPYDFEPNGATFDPPIILTWEYDPDDLPAGVVEGNLILAFYDEVAGEWVELECTVDTDTNTITASVSHFTVFVILGEYTPRSPEPVASEPPTVTTDPITIVLTPTPSTPTPSTPTSPEPELSPTPVPSPETSSALNWWLIIGLVVGGLLSLAALAVTIASMRLKRRG